MANSTSLSKDFCVQKLDTAILMISRLSDADYPHTDSREALFELQRVYELDRQRLLTLLGAQDNTILEYCRRANINIVRLKKFIGMLLRSTNLRNAFEIYFPIKLYAQSILGNSTKLVLSSEWEFSPFIYPVALPELPNFIFIGIPASECQNPLIVPLAGHELGHVVWNRKGAKQIFDKEIVAEILRQYRGNWNTFIQLFKTALPPDRLEGDMFLRSIWGKSYKLAQRQLEEVFCDYFGLHIFGVSFMYSFQYLLSPGLGQNRSINYPKNKDRADFLGEAATQWGMNSINGFSTAFSEQDSSLTKEDRFIVKMADDTTQSLRGKLLAFMNDYTCDIPRYEEGSEDENRAKASMMSLVPAASAESIASIINAAWSIRLNLDKWDILSDIEEADIRRTNKIRVLRDLTLKGLEVFEFNKRVEKYAA